MATDFDPYRILGIDRTAFSDDIYNAYQRAIAQHPNDAQAQREIEAAYAILGNFEQRREYDARLREREIAGAQPVLPDAVTATQPSAPGEVPWTLADMAKALLLPAILVSLNLIAFIAGDTETDDLTEGEWIANFGFGFLVELAFLGLAWHFGLRKYGLTWRAFGFVWPKDTGLRVWIAVILGPFGLLYAYILPLAALGIEPEGNIPENVYDFVVPVIMLGILSVVMAPVVEEVFFRAFLYQGFAKKWGVVAGIAISAIIFGSAHIANVDSLIVAPAIAGIGAIFAWAYWKTGSIYPSIIAHVVFNAVSFTSGFFIE